jgi:hypothetical protein
MNYREAKGIQEGIAGYMVITMLFFLLDETIAMLCL